MADENPYVNSSENRNPDNSNNPDNRDMHWPWFVVSMLLMIIPYVGEWLGAISLVGWFLSLFGILTVTKEPDMDGKNHIRFHMALTPEQRRVIDESKTEYRQRRDLEKAERESQRKMENTLRRESVETHDQMRQAAKQDDAASVYLDTENPFAESGSGHDSDMWS